MILPMTLNQTFLKHFHFDFVVAAAVVVAVHALEEEDTLMVAADRMEELASLQFALVIKNQTSNTLNNI